MPAVHFDSSAGRLAGLLDPPVAEPAPRGPRGAVICHPHPVFGGTMHNKVVHALAKAAAARGLAALRFDFRGAGSSEGAHDGGRGEQDDARAALDFLAGEVAGPSASLLMIGYSFGSWVGTTASLRDERVGALAVVAPPVNAYDYGALAATEKPLLVVYAEADELVPAERVRDWIVTCRRPPRVVGVPGAGHLFHGQLRAVRQALDGFLLALAE